MNTLSKSLLGIAVTAGAVYLFDPVSGRRRRVLLRDQCARTARAIELGTRDARQDISHRMHDLAMSAKTHLTDPTSDKAICKHARSALKRSVSRPDTIDIKVHGGKVFMRGDVYSHEHQRALDEVRSIEGVRVVTDHLSLREAAEGVRPLSNGLDKAGDGWSIAGRLCAGAAGCALLVWGVRERKALSEFGASVGQAVWRFSKQELGDKLDGIKHTLDKGIDAAEEVRDDAAVGADVHTRKWPGESTRTDATQTRVAV